MVSEIGSKEEAAAFGGWPHGLMVTFIVIRHGYSLGNKEKRFTGQMDVPLDAVGYAQAQDTAAYILQNYKIDRVYSSDLCRAYDTVKPIADALGLDVIARKDLREVDVGNWQWKRIDALEKEFPESFASYRENPGLFSFDGGESYAGAMERARLAFVQMAEESEGKTVVVGTHGGIIRALRAAWEKIPLNRFKEIPPIPNSSITIAEYEDGVTKLVEIGCTKHLADKTTEFGANPAKLV